MDWEKVLWALGGFAGGLLSQLLKLVVPGYTELVKENADLREKVRTLEDSIGDEELGRIARVADAVAARKGQ